MKEYGEGYSYDSLKLKSRFAKEFTIDEIREQPVPQIPWGTIVEIMKKSKTHDEMLWYIKQTYKNNNEHQKHTYKQKWETILDGGILS